MRPPAFWPRWLEFLSCLRRHFMDDQCLRTAASLAYTTLLSLVPLMAVVLVTLSAFPSFQSLGDKVENLLFSSFVPGITSRIWEYLQSFTAKASQLRAAGVVVLIFTSLSMMATIESSFNRIWRVRESRPLWLRFLVYWAVLTLGPLLIGMGLAATTYLISLPLVSDIETRFELRGHLLLWLPMLLTTLAFTLLYALMPNRSVPLRLSLYGGVVAGLLFELAKRGFAYYVTHFPSHEAIYGAFASVPVFLLWIYISWVVILFGAEVTRSLMAFGRGGDHSGGSGRLRALYRIVGRLWRAGNEGRSLSLEALLLQEPGLAYTEAGELLQLLHDAGWAETTESGGWVLLRDPATVSLGDLYALLPDALIRADDAGLEGGDGWDQALNRRLRLLAGQGRELLGVSLRSLYAESGRRC